MAFEKLAEIIFPNVEHDREYYIAKYPKRNLKEGARVTRYAPSPTGFQHIGGVFAALINERLASQSEGVFYLRIVIQAKINKVIITRIGNIVMKNLNDSAPSSISSFLQEGKFFHSTSFTLPS